MATVDQEGLDPVGAFQEEEGRQGLPEGRASSVECWDPNQKLEQAM